MTLTLSEGGDQPFRAAHDAFRQAALSSLQPIHSLWLWVRPGDRGVLRDFRHSQNGVSSKSSGGAEPRGVVEARNTEVARRDSSAASASSPLASLGTRSA